MDRTTRDLLDALEHPGGAFLLDLLEGPATEAALVIRVGDVSQSTANRRLARLEEIGLARRVVGHKHQPGRAWELIYPDGVDQLLSAALTLAGLLAEQDRVHRDAAAQRLRRARARRKGLSSVDAGAA